MSAESVPVPPSRTSLGAVAVWLAFMGLWAVTALAPSGADGHAVGWVLPSFIYGGALVALLSWWRWLPEPYRTGVRRGRLRPWGAPAAEEPPPPLLLTLSGSDDDGPVTLQVADEGLVWTVHARRSRPARELRIPWGDLDGVQAHKTWSKSTIAPYVVLTALQAWAFPAMRTWLAGTAVLMALMWIALWRRSRSLSIATATHRLGLTAPTLDADTVARLEAVVRHRAPRAASPRTRRDGWSAPLLVPLLRLGGVVRGGAQVRTELQAARRAEDPEAVRAGELQWRMGHLWTGVLCGVGPLAVGVGAAIAHGDGVRGLVGWAFAWMMGVFARAQLGEWFARRAGVEVLDVTSWW